MTGPETIAQVPDGLWYAIGALITAGLPAWLAARSARRADRSAQAAHHQVSANHHVSDPPTLMDKVDDVKRGQDALREVVELYQDRNEREFRHLWRTVNHRRRWWRK